MHSVTSLPNATAQSRRQSRAEALAAVEAHLPIAGMPVVHPVLVVLCGLPGSGKSYLARQLQPRLLATVVETDCIRRVLFPCPRYTGSESAWVYAVCHALLSQLLGQRRSVIFDATNLLERSRRSLYDIAEQARATLVIVHTVAPDDVIRQRLQTRQQQRDPDNNSEANLVVYEKLRLTEQPIRRRHLLIDTTQECEQSIHCIMCECGLPIVCVSDSAT